MNEPEILDAYRSLSAPVSAPDDVLARVEQRITRRRRARRGLAAAGTLAVVGGVGFVALGGDDGADGTGQVADPGGTETSTLVATLTDGSTQTWATGDVSVGCNPEGTRLWLARNSMTASYTEAEGSEETDVERPVLIVELVVGKVQPGDVFTLPYDSRSGSSDDRAMTFFFTADEGRERDNELSSAEGGSSGTVTVNDLGCGPTPHLDVTIDGTLGSEVGQPALAITGSYHS